MVVKKEAITKDIARAWLGDVPANKRFWCHDGRSYKNMEELARALPGMTDETFKFHVNKDKNDFSNWLRDVIGDVALANELQKVTSRTAAARTVETRLNTLKKKL